MLAITGTNGKTTVTALTGALCRGGGPCHVSSPATSARRCSTCSRPTTRARAAWPDVFVLELSSFQLETTSSLRPTAAAVLNVTENHLDRYRASTTTRPRRRASSRKAACRCVNRDDARSLRDAHPGPHDRVVRRQRAGSGRRMGPRALRPHDVARARRRAPRADDVAVAGRPPQRAQRAGGAGARRPRSRASTATCSMRSSHSQACRIACSAIAEAGRVVYIDDSKATTVVATQAALDGIERPAVLIAGGDGKGQDFRPLKSSVDADCRAVLLIGRDAPLIASALEGTPAQRRDGRHAATRRSIARSRSPSPATPCCCRRRARASTSSRATSSAARRSRRACSAAAGGDRAHA